MRRVFTSRVGGGGGGGCGRRERGSRARAREPPTEPLGLILGPIEK